MKCFLDRIEEKIAVILVKGGGRMEIPVGNFSFNVEEGMHLNAEFSIDDAERERVRKNIQEIRKRLLKKNREKK
ncbi:MAG: hypothetical protein COT16_03270 [Elusimicrobia bacterium CG08_land_8_20_14_0_20_44_26]|nr:MAG: hypothetical protein COT16_03270 [Elusimicrobia bacterium CG08_land_8_20_14_0_20_44_26]